MKRFPSIIENRLSPTDLFSKEQIKNFIEGERIERIRQALISGNCEDIEISYIVPWTSLDAVEKSSLDLILSHAVMEHVADLNFAYNAFQFWVSEGGWVSHSIDFRCYGTANKWNGHWTYSDSRWEKIRRKEKYIINREPYSTHKRLLEDNSFQIINEIFTRDSSGIKADSLAGRFRSMSEEDLLTRGVIVQAMHKQSGL